MLKGYVHIYTGCGKGKTTAAVGLALRAQSRGLRVLFVQFMKGGKTISETKLLEQCAVTVKKFNSVRSPLFDPDVKKSYLKKHMFKALDDIKKIMIKKDFDVIILDEFLCLLSEKLLTDREALDFISHRPFETELVLTGRGAPKKLIQAADYATEMKMLKHPFSKKVPARKGIEY